MLTIEGCNDKPILVVGISRRFFGLLGVLKQVGVEFEEQKYVNKGS